MNALRSKSLSASLGTPPPHGVVVALVSEDVAADSAAASAMDPAQSQVSGSPVDDRREARLRLPFPRQRSREQSRGRSQIDQDVSLLALGVFVRLRLDRRSADSRRA